MSFKPNSWPARGSLKINTHLVDLHVGLPIDDAVKVTGAQAIGLLETSVLCPAAADASCSGGGGGGDRGGATWIRWQPGRRYCGPTVGRPLFAQLVQVGQRAHRPRTAAATRERRVRRERRRVTSRRPEREIPERMRPVDTRVRRANVSPQTRWRQRPGPMMRARRRSRTAPASRRTFNGRSIQPWTPRDLLRRRQPANNDCRSSRRCRLPRTSTRGRPHTVLRDACCAEPAVYTSLRAYVLRCPITTDLQMVFDTALTFY